MSLPVTTQVIMLRYNVIAVLGIAGVSTSTAPSMTIPVSAESPHAMKYMMTQKLRAWLKMVPGRSRIENRQIFVKKIFLKKAEQTILSLLTSDGMYKFKGEQCDIDTHDFIY